MKLVPYLVLCLIGLIAIPAATNAAAPGPLIPDDEITVTGSVSFNAAGGFGIDMSDLDLSTYGPNYKAEYVFVAASDDQTQRPSHGSKVPQPYVVDYSLNPPNGIWSSAPIDIDYTTPNPTRVWAYVQIDLTPQVAGLPHLRDTYIFVWPIPQIGVTLTDTFIYQGSTTISEHP